MFYKILKKKIKLKSKDAYLLLINSSNKINLLLYFKLSPEQMKKELGSCTNSKQCYLTFIFDSDNNYYAYQLNEKNLLHFITGNNVEHITILEKKYTDLPKHFLDKISIEEFYKKKNFCEEQIFYHF